LDDHNSIDPIDREELRHWLVGGIALAIIIIVGSVVLALYG
jgi:hypothetical protein